ncbi:MAG: NAD-dependent epimerase/dehydratase [Solirubrobacterales bacterium]|nr:NAD-dependent epimerase/dehydratase [Solirubrobacterales bacterium]
MDITLTGGTGLIGSAVLRSLLDHGHVVTALVRSDRAAATVEASGAIAVRGDLLDGAWLAEELAGAHGVIHTASPGDATSADVDRAVAEAAVSALTGSGKRYLHTSGVWIRGSGEDITETSRLNPPGIVAWRAEIEQLVLGTEGLNGIVIEPGIVYGLGRGLPNVLMDGPRNAKGALTLIGDGSQHWVTVHVDDLAELYVLALERGRPGERYIGASGVNPTVRELGLTLSTDEEGGAGVVAEAVAATRKRLGGPLAGALLLDQQATGAKAKAELGWDPIGPTLVEELRDGSYAAG